MRKNNLLSVFCHNIEIGKLAVDEQKNRSYFQYNPEFLDKGKYCYLFPVTSVLRRTTNTQVFSKFNNDCFRGLAPMFADSLPDSFVILFTENG